VQMAVGGTVVVVGCCVVDLNVVELGLVVDVAAVVEVGGRLDVVAAVGFNEDVVVLDTRVFLVVVLTDVVVLTLIGWAVVVAGFVVVVVLSVDVVVLFLGGGPGGLGCPGGLGGPGGGANCFAQRQANYQTRKRNLVKQLTPVATATRQMAAKRTTIGKDFIFFLFLDDCEGYESNNE
jgi:hypothetical protein